jgi:preprotein translocase subunit SecE
MQKLFSFGLYKRTQGRIARQATFGAIALAIALGCWQLSGVLRGYGTAIEFGVPGLLLLLGWFLAFRLVNWPRFADFLIAVEAEMNKVTWPSRTELIRASAVVLITIFLLATVLFLYDMFWRWFLMDLLNIANT